MPQSSNPSTVPAAVQSAAEKWYDEKHVGKPMWYKTTRLTAVWEDTYRMDVFINEPVIEVCLGKEVDTGLSRCSIKHSYLLEINPTLGLVADKTRIGAEL